MIISNTRAPRALLAALIVIACGCTRVAERVERTPLPPGAPDAKAILDDLEANDEAIRGFKATGAFTLASPELAAVQRFKSSTVIFRRPACLQVVGRKYLGSKVFRLTCVGDEFIVEFPATRDEAYYRLEGEEFASVPGRKVSPVEILHEMVLPEPWTELKKRRVRMTGYDEATQTATLLIGPKRAPRRLIEVTGPPWVIVRAERYDEHGNMIAHTVKSDYRWTGGIRFPYYIDAEFPGEESRMTLEMRKITPNIETDDAVFDIRAIARNAGIARKAPAR